MIDPTIQDARREPDSAAGRWLSRLFFFTTAALGAFLIARSFRMDLEIPAWAYLAHQLGGFAIFGIGFAALVVSATRIAQVKGALAIALAVLGLGAAAGIWLAFRGAEQDASPVVLPLVIFSALSVLVGLGAMARQNRRRALMAQLTPHQAVMHEQGYTDATWQEYSGSIGSVVLRFVDRDGRDRFVTRGLTQYRDEPIPNGTALTMYWDPQQPANEKRMVSSASFVAAKSSSNRSRTWLRPGLEPLVGCGMAEFLLP